MAVHWRGEEEKPGTGYALVQARHDSGLDQSDNGKHMSNNCIQSILKAEVMNSAYGMESRYEK